MVITKREDVTKQGFCEVANEIKPEHVWTGLNYVG